jgi:hypothetical protein
MPKDLRKRAALALRLATRTRDQVNRERLVALAAECLERAAEKEKDEEIVSAHGAAEPATAIFKRS